MITTPPGTRSTGDQGLDAAGPASPRQTLWAVVILAFAGLIVRLLFSGRYTFEGLVCDGAAYMEVADNIRSGAGWVTHSLRFLFLLPPTLPQADAHWSPLYPLLTSWAFTAFGPSFATAKVVPLVFGTLVPGAIYLFTASLARSWKAGLTAGLLAVFHPTLVTWSLTIMTEIGSVFFVAATLFLLVSPRTVSRPHWLGISLGLAYLMKYQAILLWVAVVLFYALNVPWRTALRRLVIAGAMFVLVITPWLVRNALTFGDPFYTDLRYNVISYYPEFGGEPRYLSSLEMPVGTFRYMSTHAATVLAYLKNNVQLLARGFFEENAGSVLLVVFGLLALPRMAREWRRWTPVLAFGVVHIIAVGISIPQVRYLHVLIPLWLGMVALGTVWLWERAGDRRGFARPLRAAIVLMMLLAVADETRSTSAAANDAAALWSPSANFCALEAAAASDFIRANTTPSEAVFVPETFHYALLFGRNVIQIPFDEGDLRRLGERYGVRYLVISTRDLEKRLPSWREHPPGWTRLVRLVPAAEIPRPRAAPAYPHVSDVRIYELSPS